MTTVDREVSAVKQLLEVTRIRPYSQGMTESLETAKASLINALREISDDAERYQEAKELEVWLDESLKQIKADVAKSLYSGRSWNQVGKLLGVTGSRAEQISRAAR